MNESAIILNGNCIQKVSNLKRKYNKLINNPNIKILEECLSKDLEDRYNFWKGTKPEEKNETKEIKLYHFKNSKDGSTLTSIFSSIEEMKQYDMGDTSWYDNYERVS